MFYSWGKNTKEWSYDFKGEDLNIVCVYSYFAVLFVFPVAWNLKWYIVSDKRSEDVQVSYLELKNKLGEHTPSLSLWTRFGLLFVFAFFVFSTILAGVL